MEHYGRPFSKIQIALQKSAIGISSFTYLQFNSIYINSIQVSVMMIKIRMKQGLPSLGHVIKVSNVIQLGIQEKRNIEKT